jgi:pimeloyl-ACP methyl ester carboxylesterase
MNVVRTGTLRTEDGALLVWRAEGEGPATPLLCSNGIGVATFFWKHIVSKFAPRRAVITWDYRGHGQSPVPPHPERTTVALCASDLWRIADAAGAPRAVLVGHSMGCQVLLEAVRQAPRRAAALVPMLGTSGGALKTFLGLGEALVPLYRALLAVAAAKPQVSEKALRAALRLPGVWEAVKLLGIVHPDLCPREAFEPYFAHLRALDLRCYFALAQDLLGHDASDLLPSIRVPTLVVAGEKDLFTPLPASERMAKAIAGAELLVLQGGSHAALVEQPARIDEAVEGFLRRHAL